MKNNAGYISYEAVFNDSKVSLYIFARILCFLKFGDGLPVTQSSRWYWNDLKKVKKFAWSLHENMFL